MLRVAWKSVLGNKLRLALTGIAIIIGVAFVSGTLVLTDSIGRAFDGLLTEVNAGIDGYVNPAEELAVATDGPPSGAEQLATIDEDLLEQVRGVEGIGVASGFVEGYAQIIDKEGEPIGQQGPPRLGFSWSDIDDEEGGVLQIRDGRSPQAAGEVVIDAVSAETGGYAVGEDVTIITTAGPASYELVGIVGFGTEDNLLGATIASFDLGQAQELFGLEGRFTQIAFTAASDASVEDVVDGVAAAVADDDTATVTSADDQLAEDQAEITEGLGFLNAALLGFAGIALFVGAFLIVNTFSIIVAQRTREFALLRAVGASGAQVRRVVLVEAFAVGLVASTIGLLGGIVFGQLLQLLFDAIGFSLPDGGLVIKPRTIIASYVIGVGITMLAAILPARRAARVAPIEALRGAGDQDPERIGVRRSIGGGVLAGLGALGLAVGLVGSTSQTGLLVGFGAASLFLGIALLAPHLASPMARLLGVVAARRGVAGVLARNNAQRNPKRTASTASALMIGVALVSFVSIFASSATASINQIFESQLRADLLVSNTSFGPTPLSLADDLRADGDLGQVGSLRFPGPVTFDDGTEDRLAGISVPEIASLVDLAGDEGDLADLAVGQVFVRADRAESDGLAVGDTVVVDTPRVDDVSLEVAGLFEDDGGFIGTGFVVAAEQFDELFTGVTDQIVLVDAADGVDLTAARDAVESVLADYPGLQVQDQADLASEFQGAIDGLLNLLIGLLMLAVVIALIGIVNTLALSIFERTREIGLLRAVGMSRSQVRTMIRWEAVMVAVFGAVLGVAVGSFLGWAMVTALPDLQVLEFPATRLVVYVVFAAIAGVLAAILPARRASRLDVLEAVTAE